MVEKSKIRLTVELSHSPLIVGVLEQVTLVMKYRSSNLLVMDARKALGVVSVPFRGLNRALFLSFNEVSNQYFASRCLVCFLS